MSESLSLSGAELTARSLRALGVTVVFGIVGIPIVEIAEECIKLGIRFIGFRNEQAASYAASAFGYLTGKPGVLLVVGGPGVIHALAGIHSSQKNTWPLLVLAGAPPSSHHPFQGSFQGPSSLLVAQPHSKFATNTPRIEKIPECIFQAFSTSFWGRPGVSFVEIPADFVTGRIVTESPPQFLRAPTSPRIPADESVVIRVAEKLRSAKRPLIIFGKGAAYSRCEALADQFINATKIPFLPTPMGKGVLPDDHPLNSASARSYALKNADVVLVVGARLNWILHYGDASKWAENVTFIKIDISPEEIHRNLRPVTGGEVLGRVGDCATILSQLASKISSPLTHLDDWTNALTRVKETNNRKSREKLLAVTTERDPLGYHRVFWLISETLVNLAGGSSDSLVFISEGANTMDISRSIIPISRPRQRLDAGTDATMGVGLGYAIAAWEAYNGPLSSTPQRKKIIAIEGDSAIGFSAMEIETMTRYKMDIIIFVINNGGIYHGENYSSPESRDLIPWEDDLRREGAALPPTALSHNTSYEVVAEGLGARGFKATNEKELLYAIELSWSASGPVLINVIISSGSGSKLDFAWNQAEAEKPQASKL